MAESKEDLQALVNELRSLREQRKNGGADVSDAQLQSALDKAVAIQSGKGLPASRLPTFPAPAPAQSNPAQASKVAPQATPATPRAVVHNQPLAQPKPAPVVTSPTPFKPASTSRDLKDNQSSPTKPRDPFNNDNSF